ncbi:MAG: ABC transporter ATP-binding protein [Butyrivibrio sp.]
MFKIWKQYENILSPKDKRKIFGIVVLMVISGFLEILSLSMIVPLIAAIVNMELITKYEIIMKFFVFFGLTDEKSMLIAMAVGFVALMALKNLVIFLMERAKKYFIAKGKKDTANKLFGIYITRPYVYFLHCNSGEIITVINVLVEKVYSLLQDILTLTSKVIVVIALVIVMMAVDWKVSVFIISVFIVMTIILYFTMYRKDEAVGEKATLCTVKMMDIVNQTVGGIKDIKVLNREKYFSDKYRRYSNKNYRLEKEKFIYDTSPKHLSEVVVSVCIAGYILFSIITGRDMQAVLVGMSAVSIAVVRIVPSVNSINSCFNRIMYNKPMLMKISREVINDINSKEAINFETDPEPFPLNDRIVFDHVSFMYPDGTENVISDITLTINKGDRVGIIGASGEGKTTFVNILLGFLEPNEGRIMVDGGDIRHSIKGWMQNIGYIPQMIFLVDDTIRNNIVFGSRDIADEKIWEVLRLVQLDKFVQSLDRGLDSQVGENGVRLSGGQRQRIGIARALLRDPDILVFDEATAALDDETESEIMNEIYGFNRDKTIIIISHRMSTLEGCDRIYRVVDGNVIEDGTEESNG